MPNYDVLIDYDDDSEEENAVYAKDVEAEFYTKTLTRRLTEILVDPGYELESVAPKDLWLLENLRERFSSRKNEAIKFYDLKAASYKIGNDNLMAISDFQIIHMMRNLWRAGYIRRYVLGQRKIKRAGRGEWYGVHYKLYPKEK